jgi:hypothetical protein
MRIAAPALGSRGDVQPAIAAPASERHNFACNSA